MSEDVLERAKRLVHDGQVEEARDILEEITSEEPSNEAAWLLYLDISARNEIERIEFLRQYLLENPDSWRARQTLQDLESRHPRPRHTDTPARPPPPPEPITRPRRVVLERFRRGPINVSTTLPPGAIGAWVSRVLLFLVLVMVALLAFLPIWDGRNLFSYLQINLPSLPGVRALLDDQPAATPLPGPDSILFADLSAVCPWEDDVPPGASVDEVSTRVPAGRLLEGATEGLSRYYGVWWLMPEQLVWGCEVMVYDSGQGAEEAYRAVGEMVTASGESLRMNGAPRGSVVHIIEGTQIVLNLAFRDGRVIVLLSSMAPELEAGQAAMQQLVELIQNRLDPLDTR